WLKNIAPMESLMNIVLLVISPQQYHCGLKAQQEVLKDGNTALKPKDHFVAQAWPSVFTGISIISNRETPAHRDRGSDFPDYDLLTSLGTHTFSQLEVHDVGRIYSYQPGVVVGICGKLLQHSVSTWSGGERVCYARFVKDKVMKKMECAPRDWVTVDAFQPVPRSK
ncbi:hypothetical protein SCHPADRAFT_839812, partial [Schizopora paradoxa]